MKQQEVADPGYEPWGWLVALDLHDCDDAAIRDPEAIRRFFVQLVSEIGMVAHGPVLIERFGTGDLEGWSAMQFIETSSITLHADEYRSRCFIDIFSCKPFSAAAAATFAAAWFGGRPYIREFAR